MAREEAVEMESDELPRWGMAWMFMVQVFMLVGLRVVYKRYFRASYIVSVRANWWLTSLNAVLWPSCVLADYVRYKVPRIGKMLVRPLTMERLVSVAQKRTGLSDWKPGATFPLLYEAAVERMNEVSLSPFGRLMTFDYLMRRLIRRLEVVDAMKKRPEKPELSDECVFIVGLPRTGTTLLHRLLALDPEARYPRTFELMDPLNLKGYPRDKRIKWLSKKLDLVKKVIPQIEAIHELGADEAEECLLGLSLEVPLLPMTFRHMIRHCAQDADTPDRVKMFDLTPAYRMYKRQLEFIADADANDADKKTTTPPKRWCLKCPAHLAFIDNLVEVFPKAKLVWTHRDPRESLPSLGSMFRTFADMVETDDVNLRAIGSEQLLFWAAALNKADRDMADRVRHAGQDSVAHVDFKRLLADPVAVVADLYAAFGWTVSPAFHTNMTNYLQHIHAKRANIPPHLKRFHQYSLEEYGLTRALVKDTMKDYYAKHLPNAP